ncbi:MAG: restriction endonuclease subunit S [Methylococcaceae bacterium]|nr:restriction endonuclease subunit S [Methylococcaceae bacterium]
MSWGNVRLGDVTLVKAGGGAPQDTDSFSNSGTSFIRAGSLPKLLSGSDESELEKISDEVAKKHNLKKFPPNVILFAKSGMSATKGHIYKTLNETYVVNHLAILECKDEITPEYLYRVLQLHSPTQLILDPAYPSIRISDIEEFSIPLPTLPEQKRIAAILDKADELKRKREAAIAKLDQLAQSIFVEMFGNVALNDKSWEIKALENISTKITDGEHQTPRRTDSGIKLLSARNVQDGYLSFKDVDYIDDEEYKKISKRCNPERNDILISCSGSIGRVSIVNTDEPLALVRSAALVKPNSALVKPKYLEGFLRTPFMRDTMIKKAHSSSQANLFQGPLRTLRIAIPPIPLQEEFINRISKLEKLKVDNTAALAKQNNLFTSLQHQAFAGHL